MKKKRTNHVVTMHKHRLFEYHIIYPETKIAYDSFGMNIFISVNYKENIYNEFIYDGLKNISKYILIAKKLVEKCLAWRNVLLVLWRKIWNIIFKKSICF